VWYSSVGCSVAQEIAAQLSGVQRSSKDAVYRISEGAA
jgi:hypothetical protein